jgi:hypothetical protein
MKTKNNESETPSPEKGEKEVQKKSTEHEQTPLKNPHGTENNPEQVPLQHPHESTTPVDEDKNHPVEQTFFFTQRNERKVRF